MQEENYFDKFMNDLEKREEEIKKRNEALQKADEQWSQRRKLDVLYREHAASRIRCGK